MKAKERGSENLINSLIDVNFPPENLMLKGPLSANPRPAQRLSGIGTRHFRASLSRDGRSLVEIFMGGASSPPTWRPEEGGAHNRNCPVCGVAVFSNVLHFICERAHFQAERISTQTKWKLNQDWWASLPGVSSKSVWITYDAHRTADRRSELRVAICEAAIHVVQDTGVRGQPDGAAEESSQEPKHRPVQPQAVIGCCWLTSYPLAGGPVDIVDGAFGSTGNEGARKAPRRSPPLRSRAPG